MVSLNRAIAETGSFTHYNHVLLPRLGSCLSASHRRVAVTFEATVGQFWPWKQFGRGNLNNKWTSSNSSRKSYVVHRLHRAFSLSFSLTATEIGALRLMNSGSISTLTRRPVHSHRRLTAPVASLFSPRPTLRNGLSESHTKLWFNPRDITFKNLNAGQEGFIDQIEYYEILLESSVLLIDFLIWSFQ